MNRILVLGGTGFVGRSVCEKLSARSSSGCIVVPTRRPQHANNVRSLPTVQAVAADVHDEAQLARLLAGVDAVVNLVAILHGSRADFERVHVALPQRLVRACGQAGVRRVVHVSALGIGPTPEAAPSQYLRSKAAGEAVFKASGLDLTLLRPSVIFGAEDKFLNLFAQIQAIAPVLPLAGSGARFQPVWVEDVASAIVACLDQPASVGRTFECTGPGAYTLSRLVQLAGQWSGHERPQLPLPDVLGRLQAWVMEMLPGQPLMSRDNLDSMRVPNVASAPGAGMAGLADLGITATALEAVAPGYLGSRMARARFEQWRSGAGRG